MGLRIGTFKGLTRSQKEAAGLLGIGTFLEYFDLFLYIHMAIFLNEIFFPQTDPRTDQLLAAFAFCSTYVFRPLGALIFGYLGDTIGRKSTVILTTWLMALSCFLMANLPTYAQIGITASYLVTLVRVIQGMASMGEVIGAEVYVTEITKPPIQYSMATMVAVCGALGGTAALAIASIVTTTGFNWRIAFLFGASIATIGGVARIRLRETKDFAEAIQKLKTAKQKIEARKAKINKISAIALFCIHCTWPVCFYFAYMYCGIILKDTLGLTADEVIKQNFLVSIGQVSAWISLSFLSYKYNPILIIRIRLIIFMMFIAISPYVFANLSSPKEVLFVQLFVVIFGFTGLPGIAIFYKHLLIYRRFTYASFTYALSRALMYIMTSFGLVYLASIFDQWVMLITMMPLAIIFSFAINHFAKLEKVRTS